MDRAHYVIIGNGPAGNQAALTLREAAPDARITLISRDPESCYRPHLLPKFIAGKITESDLMVFPRETYLSKGIKLRNGQKVVDVRPADGELTLDHKEIISFSGLIIAVGGHPRIPESMHAFQDLLFRMKTLDDARAWIKHLARVESVFIIGGDLTSLAVIRALLHLKKKVYFMLDEDAFWPLRPDQTVFDEVAQRLTGKGVEVLSHRRVMGVTRLPEDAYEVFLDDRTLKVGMIGAFFGLAPDVRFLAKSGLKIDRGILVDEYLNTGIKGVYATGDCAQVYHPEIRDYWVSSGHDNAVELGRLAALNLAGGDLRADVSLESLFSVDGITVNTSWWVEF
ncbi:MAG: FAD-dependent oxidoreductase [Deltaproteobacteria bacterium]|nr:FAD-dependent oxidoreductase [Deltaproteobacteria bacterium]